MKDRLVFERDVNGRRYRIAAQSVWDPVRGRSVARQIVLGPATAAPVADLGATRTIGTQAVGDVGALIWVAEQLDLIGHIDRACGNLGAKGGPSVGELALAVAIQRGLFARTEAGLGGVSGWGRTAPVVSAFFGLQWPSLSS